MKRVALLVLLLLFGVMLMYAVLMLPGFGSFRNRDVAGYYLGHGLEDTGSANLVNSVVWDYRGYDTLGEEIVLFTSVVGIFLISVKEVGNNKEKSR